MYERYYELYGNECDYLKDDTSIDDNIMDERNDIDDESIDDLSDYLSEYANYTTTSLPHSDESLFVLPIDTYAYLLDINHDYKYDNNSIFQYCYKNMLE